MKVRAEDYERMRIWFASMLHEVFSAELISADADPLATLDGIAARSPAKARVGLSMGINDLIEMTAGWPEEQVGATDLRLLEDGLPTLTEMRARFSTAVLRAARRGHIKDDAEYYAVRNAAELVKDGQEPLWLLLAAYEENAAR